MGICDGRVCVVTGAGRGIGREYALMLASQGAKVVVNDIGGARDGTGTDSAPAADVVEEIVAAGGDAMADNHDVTDFEAAGALDRLEGFASHHGADFYGLPRNTGTITLRRESWTPPDSFAFGEAELKPLRAGEALPWRLV